MEKSDSIIKLAKAIIAAQSEIKVVEKEAVNPFFKSKYADLPAIFKEYQRVFLKHGVAVIQVVEGLGLRTTILHDSGEWMSGLATLNPVKNDPQGLGSAITYMRRYALAAICGIVSSEDDDDGNAGTGQGRHEQAKNPAMGHPEASKATQTQAAMAPKDAKPLPGCISEAQAKRFFAIYRFHGKTDEESKDYLKKNYGIDHSNEIKKEDYESLCAWAEGK